ncbi:MAG: AMP-binding protein, partial [Phycisphaerae bacterium]
AGILLPAGVPATVTYMATMFAGKTPVMVNWTAGLGSIISSLDRVGVDTVVTSRELIDRLGHQGIELGELEDRFVYLEDIRASLTWRDKLGVWLRSRGSLKSLQDAPIREQAVVLFTSGSETQPKAVPLTHANILANLRDIAQAIHIRRSDVVLGILPPFHSFGLMVGVVAPLCAAIRVGYHPNPNEAAAVAHVVEAYGATLAVGTPTFLSGTARAAGEDQLRSVRLAVAGAEACPRRAYETMQEAMPNATVMEGYGITECSPIVSVNDPEDPRRFTIGKPLPHVETAVVHPETGEPVEPGQTGKLLVRGPSVFEGYIGDVGGDPFVEYDGRSWYDTGDLVKQDAEGVLSFQGRLKRFEKIGGEMVSLPAIEQAVRDRFDVESTGDPQVAVLSTGGGEGRPELVLVTTLDISREEANRAVRDAGLSGLHNIQRVRKVDEIPQLGTGKTDYRTLQDRL